MPAFLIPAAIGAAALIGGSILRNDASDRREGALNNVMDARQRASGRFNERRNDLLTDALGQLPGFAERRQGLIGDAVTGLGGRGATIDNATNQGQQRILDNAAGMDLSTAIPGVGGLDTGAGAQRAMAAQGAPLTGALQGLSASQMGQLAGQRSTGNIMQQLGVGQTQLGRDLGNFQGDLSMAQANIGLQDLLNSLFMNERLQSASQVGGRSNAVGGMMQQVGGSLLGGGIQNSV